MSTKLVHIAPELPPKVGGVADYTAILSRRLVEVSDGVVEPVLVHAGNQEADAIEVEFQVVDLSGRCSASALAEAITERDQEATGPTTVLLEYAGYGYATSGAPLWLLRGVRRACTANEVQLITVFHELYGTSLRPWTRTFWAMPVQYYIATRLAHLSDGLTANWTQVNKWLSRRVDGTPVCLSPSFSNVGEPESLPSFSDREPYAVSFGGAGKKAQLYKEYGTEVCQLLQRRGIERIVDIGPTVPESVTTSLNVPVERKGILPKEEVSACLQRASLGLLNYGLHCLRKSGVWGAYAAHGVPTVLTSERRTIDTLDERKHFLLADTDAGADYTQLDMMSQAVRQWYDEYAHSRKAAHRVLGIVGNFWNESVSPVSSITSD